MPPPTTSRALSPPQAIVAAEYARRIRTPISFLMIFTVFSAMLVPLFVALFSFSTSQMRRKPIFIVVAIQVLLGIGLSVWNAYIMIHIMLSPLDPVKPAHAEAISLTTSFAPWFIDIVLLLRLHAIYPRSLTPRSKLLAIFSLPIVIKLARFTALVAFAVIWRRRNSAGPQNASSSLAPFPRPAITFEWSAQIVDNGYATAVFLWKLHRSFTCDSYNSSDGLSGLITTKIRTLFWIATTNFVFPVICSIIALITLFACPPEVSVQVSVANIYVSIIGVVFCCVWSSRSSQTWSAPTIETVELSAFTPSHAMSSRDREEEDVTFKYARP